MTASSFFFGCGGPSSPSPAASSAGNPQPTGSPQATGNPQPTPAGPITNASLVVTATASGSIGPSFAGLSYEKAAVSGQNFNGSNTDLIGLFQRLGPSILRVGGDSVDQLVWTPQGAGNKSGEVAPSDVDALAEFLEAAGWKCIYGINLGGAANGSTSPALAAAEVAYVSEKLSTSLVGIEIGNEPDGYGEPGSYFAGNWSLPQLLQLWGEFRAAIVAASPNVSITGAATTNCTGWTIPFGQAVTNSQIGLLTQHYYRGIGDSSAATAQALVSPDTKLTGELGGLQSATKSIGLSYRISECNSFSNGGAPGVSDSYASSLWAIDFLFNCAQFGATGTNFHGGGSSPGYTPIADLDGAVIEARPEYYGILFFSLAGQGTLHATQLSAGSLNATAYAISAASGGMNIVIVNKDSTQNLSLSAELPQSITSANLSCMTQLSAGASGPSLAATEGVTIQGASVGVDGGFIPQPAYTLDHGSSQLTCYVPALSAVLIQVS